MMDTVPCLVPGGWPLALPEMGGRRAAWLAGLWLAGCGGAGPAAAPDAGADVSAEVSSDAAAEAESTAPATTPVYVTFAAHLEDGEKYAVCQTYPKEREKLLAFAAMISGTPVKLNLQIDYPFLEGTSGCETAAMREKTGGTNVVDYLATAYGFELDAHQEGGWDEGADNYADVRWLLGSLTSQATESMGGVVWSDATQLAGYAAGQAGWLHPELVWTPEILTLGVHKPHHLGDFSLDDLYSGVWRPKGGGEDFWTHDPAAPWVYVAPGQQHGNWGGSSDCTFQSSADYVEVLVAYLAAGKLPAGRLYTATVALPQSVTMDAAQHPRITALIDQLAPMVATGQVVYAHFTEVAALWQTTHGEEAHRLPFDAIDPADYTCN